jgi:hypothetical protein
MILDLTKFEKTGVKNEVRLSMVCEGVPRSIKKDD